MKWLPLLLGLIVFFSGIRPWDGGAMCKEAKAAEHKACEALAQESSCCQGPAEHEDPPSEEEGCRDDCQCYCCTSLMIDPPIASSLSTTTKTSQQALWRTDRYTHNFTHLIWHPPQPTLLS